MYHFEFDPDADHYFDIPLSHPEIVFLRYLFVRLLHEEPPKESQSVFTRAGYLKRLDRALTVIETHPRRKG